ncbi:MAG: pantetheine-phosphate adenylyltransferase, partial [Saprospiraceae bacterium]
SPIQFPTSIYLLLNFKETSFFIVCQNDLAFLFSRQFENCIMMKIAVFPGSFNQLTMGHYDILQRALPLFDKIVLAIGVNPNKTYEYTIEQRRADLEDVFCNEPKIITATYEKLTVDFCRKINAKFIIRGLRSAKDFEYEQPIAQMNYLIGEGIETIFLSAQPQYSHISSSIVREIKTLGGEVAQFLPKK